MLKDWTIYKIVSPTGKVYIGKTKNYAQRVVFYRTLNCKGQKKLFASLRKHGYDNHVITIVDKFTSDVEYAEGKEMFWIKSFMSNCNKFPDLDGMNLTDGGDGTSGHTISDEAKKKIGDRTRGRVSPRKGCTLSIESIEKMKRTKRIKNMSLTEQERKDKFGKHLIGATFNKGRKPHPSAIANSIAATSMPVIQYDLLGNIVGEFNSIAEAHIKTKISNTTIQNSLKDRIRNPRFFTFKYKNK